MVICELKVLLNVRSLKVNVHLIDSMLLWEHVELRYIRSVFRNIVGSQSYEIIYLNETNLFIPFFSSLYFLLIFFLLIILWNYLRPGLILIFLMYYRWS